MRIAVASGKGGTGKTTVAVNLALTACPVVGRVPFEPLVNDVQIAGLSLWRQVEQQVAGLTGNGKDDSGN